MLVLARKFNESIVAKIGDVELAFTVLKMRGNHVQIGIDAPPEVVVHRDEIMKRIAEQAVDATPVDEREVAA